MEDSSPADGRHFRRIAYEAPARLFSATEQWDSTLLDISLKGALLQRPDDWSGAAGRRLRLAVHLENGVVMSMTVSVAFASDHALGLKCERIDMQSFAHLKRLVELNLGSSDLLNRELAALG